METKEKLLRIPKTQTEKLAVFLSFLTLTGVYRLIRILTNLDTSFNSGLFFTTDTESDLQSKLFALGFLVAGFMMLSGTYGVMQRKRWGKWVLLLGAFVAIFGYEQGPFNTAFYPSWFSTPLSIGGGGIGLTILGITVSFSTGSRFSLDFLFALQFLIPFFMLLTAPNLSDEIAFEEGVVEE